LTRELCSQNKEITKVSYGLLSISKGFSSHDSKRPTTQGQLGTSYMGHYVSLKG